MKMKKCFSWIRREMPISELSALFYHLINKFSMALLTCLLAMGGAAVGGIAGGIKGQTTETGLSRGFTVGAMVGALTAFQLMMDSDFTMVALIRSLINGNIFIEWVTPAVLKAYQSQVSSMDTRWQEFSDIFDTHMGLGLSQDRISELPVFEYNHSIPSFTCAICLQDMKDGESGRWLPRCEHMFHIQCLDHWLLLQRTCPICRQCVAIAV